MPNSNILISLYLSYKNSSFSGPSGAASMQLRTNCSTVLFQRFSTFSTSIAYLSNLNPLAPANPRPRFCV